MHQTLAVAGEDHTLVVRGGPEQHELAIVLASIEGAGLALLGSLLVLLSGRGLLTPLYSVLPLAGPE